MKLTTFFICLIALTFTGISQTLKTDNLDVNLGGVIYDVVFDEYSNAFIVVGDFTSIQGVPRQNLAMIDAGTFTVQAEAPITSINGAIRTVELKRDFLFPSPNRNYLYIGGDFTQVNGVTRNYICQLQKQEPVMPPFNSSYNVMLAWDAEIWNNFNPQNRVNDLAFKDDTLTAVGSFPIRTGITSWTSSDFDGIISFASNQNSFQESATLNAFAAMNIVEYTRVQFFDNHYFITSDALGFQRLNTNGIYVNNFQDCNANQSYVFEIHATDQDTLVFSLVDYAGGDGIAVHDLDGTLVNCPVSTPQPIILQDGVFNAEGYVKFYENKVFAAENDALLTYDRDGLTPVQPTQMLSLNNNWYSFVASGWRPQKMKVVEDKLFVFGDNLNTIDGNTHQGLAALCLPPKDASDFTNFDTLVCAEETAIYSVPTSEFSEGYKWTYTGTGAEYRVTGTGATMQPLTSNYIQNTNANSLEIYFPAGATNGSLTVEPYSTCNSPTDYQLAGGKSLTIQIVQLPDVSMPDSTFLNCYSDSAWIVVNSTTANVSSYIYRGTDTTWNDSLLQALPLPPLFTPGYYFGVVTEPINLCSNYDSTWFAIDTVPPVFGSSDVTFNPPVFSCNTPSMNIGGATNGTSIEWTYDNDPGIPLANPFDIYSTDSTAFTANVLQISNGCTTDFSVTVQVDTTSASGSIAGYPTIGIPIDSLSCNEPNLSLTCEAVNGTAAWIQNSNATLNLTEADTTGMTNNIQIYTYQTTHSTTGCVEDFEVVVYFDFDPPGLFPYSGTPSINCSQSDVELVHLNSGNPMEGWLDEFGVQSGNDTILATSAGDFYYQVEGENGCLNTDTVAVNQTLEMTISTPEDTLICPGESVSITAFPIINTGEVPTYSWSDGSTANSGTAVGGTDSELSVIVSTNSGCIGYDTADILITAPIEAFFSSSSGCTAAAIEVDSIFGGNGNYEYSLDQSNWQTTPAFTNVGIGSIAIFIRDDLGCVYTFNETVAPSGNGPNLNILVATYNDLGDTTVALSYGTSDVFDSLSWILPAAADLVYDSDSLTAFSIDLEGWYDITLLGYQDTCQYSTTNSVYFGTKPILDSAGQNFGILTFTVSPNPTTTDYFEVNATFGKSQSYTILVNSLDGQSLSGMTRSGSGTTVFETFNFPVGTAAGTYVIHLVGQYDAQQTLLIKN